MLTIGLPTVAVFLIVLRRFSPQGIRRVGSLGIDQFASVAFSVAAVVWVNELWSSLALSIYTGFAVTGWVIWVEVVLFLAGVVLTVFAPFIPPFADDFRHRPEAVAHPLARAARPVSPRPAPVAPSVTAPAPEQFAPQQAPAAGTSQAYGTPYGAPQYGAPQYGAPAYDAPAQTPAADTAEVGSLDPAVAAPVVDAEDAGFGSLEDLGVEVVDEVAVAPSASQAFWALVPEERHVIDEHGTPLFAIGPTAWALVIEDRGETFVVRHEDGRVGYLIDVTGVTRG